MSVTPPPLPSGSGSHWAAFCGRGLAHSGILYERSHVTGGLLCLGLRAQNYVDGVHSRHHASVLRSLFRMNDTALYRDGTFCSLVHELTDIGVIPPFRYHE